MGKSEVVERFWLGLDAAKTVAADVGDRIHAVEVTEERVSVQVEYGQVVADVARLVWAVLPEPVFKGTLVHYWGDVGGVRVEVWGAAPLPVAPTVCTCGGAA